MKKELLIFIHRSLIASLNTKVGPLQSCRASQVLIDPPSRRLIVILAC